MSEYETATCPQCGRLHRLINGRMCQHCGIAVAPPRAAKEPDGDDRRCLKCGVAARSDASRCRSCGSLLPEPEESATPPPVGPQDGLREPDLPEGPPVEIANGPVRMAPVEESSRDVDLPPGPPVELATEPVRIEPPHFREVDLK